jgi:hypothetical protein
MTCCNAQDLTIDMILADQLVQLAMRRDNISDEEMRQVILRARAAVIRRQEQPAA